MSDEPTPGVPTHPEAPPPGEPTQGLPGVPDQSLPGDQPSVTPPIAPPVTPVDPGFGVPVEPPRPSTLPGFNPSGSSVVDGIKARTEALLDYIHDNVPANRERAIAITNYEQAAMWAVKANFTAQPK